MCIIKHQSQSSFEKTKDSFPWSFQTLGFYGLYRFYGQLILTLFFLQACSNVSFEISPYAPRDVSIVYSAQEDMTFLFWQLGPTIDPSKVEFHLYFNQEWQQINLNQSPFPASPRKCNKQKNICYQYQISGKFLFDLSQNIPIRSYHQDEGIYHSYSTAIIQEVNENTFPSKTFEIEPIALDLNRKFDPLLFDWFKERGLSFVRDFEWQLYQTKQITMEEMRLKVLSAKQNLSEIPNDFCSDLPYQQAKLLSDTSLPMGWEDQPLCIKFAPKRRDKAGAYQMLAFLPSARLFASQITYIPNKEIPNVIFFSLTDLFIKSEDRCDKLKKLLINTARDGLSKYIPNDSLFDLGDYFPVETESQQSSNGCQQIAEQDYPISEILNAISNQIALIKNNKSTLIYFLYLNNQNRNDVIPTHLIDQLNALRQEMINLPRIGQAGLYDVSFIGQAIALQSFGWREANGWQALESENFENNLKQQYKDSLPFFTQLHENNQHVYLNRPQTTENILSFKICRANPSEHLLAVVPNPSLNQGEGDPQFQVFDTYDWPELQTPSVHIILPILDRVYRDVYGTNANKTTIIEYETCTRFCGHPFRSNAKIDYLEWANTQDCQKVSQQ